MLFRSQLGALEDAERKALLLPVDALVASLPSLDLDAGEAQRLMQGRRVERPEAGPTGRARVYGPGHEFLGVVEVENPGVMVPQRLKSQAGVA